MARRTRVKRSPMNEDVHLGTCADCGAQVRKKPLYCESSETCQKMLRTEGPGRRYRRRDPEVCFECGEGTFLCIECQLMRKGKSGKTRIARVNTRQDDFQKRTTRSRSTFVCTKCLFRCALRSTCGDREPEREDCLFGFEASWFRSRGRVKSR